jgi:epoxyqueuosine reductase
LISDAELPADTPMKERCGACSACLSACPTAAFVAPRELDARRCISYLTIEQRGSVPPALREPVGDWLFGCDACQDVCPFNQAAGSAQGADAFVSSERWQTYDAEQLLRFDQADYERYVEGSALKRAGRDGLARNAALVLGNVGERRHLPVLREAAQGHDNEVVREMAAWAARRIEERG